jgi:hypothetical protein
VRVNWTITVLTRRNMEAIQVCLAWSGSGWWAGVCGGGGTRWAMERSGFTAFATNLTLTLVGLGVEHAMCSDAGSSSSAASVSFLRPPANCVSRTNSTTCYLTLSPLNA